MRQTKKIYSNTCFIFVLYIYLYMSNLNMKTMRYLVNLRSLKVNKFTSQITVEHNNSEESFAVTRQMRAIAILLGGYNEFGRSIDIEKHRNRKKRFFDILEEIENDLD